MVEIVPVADTETIVHRQNNVAVGGEILIHRVRIRVVIHVVPAEQHLPGGTAVHEDDGGLLRRTTRALEQLTVDHRSVSGAEDDHLWCHELLGWEVRRDVIGGDETRRASGRPHRSREWWTLGA